MVLASSDRVRIQEIVFFRMFKCLSWVTLVFIHGSDDRRINGDNPRIRRQCRSHVSVVGGARGLSQRGLRRHSSCWNVLVEVAFSLAPGGEVLYTRKTAGSR